MFLKAALPVSAVVLLLCLAGTHGQQSQATDAKASAKRDSPHAPLYDKDGRLLFPSHYREWVFLSSGVNMSYDPPAQAAGRTMFDNVFVNPEAYANFLQTGTWADKTVMVLESRIGMDKGSINQRGHFQGTVMGLEVHVKDESRFAGKWAFFHFDNEVSGSLFPKEATCYSCHTEHAAVDTTFVQFYPTLLPIAKQKNTLSQSYLKDEAATK